MFNKLCGHLNYFRVYNYKKGDYKCCKCGEILCNYDINIIDRNNKLNKILTKK